MDNICLTENNLQTIMDNVRDVIRALTPDWQLIDGEIIPYKEDAFLVEDFQEFPKDGGVYVICCDCCDGPLYVGKTSNLYQRFRTGHHVVPHLLKHENPVLVLTYINDYFSRSYIEKCWIKNAEPFCNREPSN